MIISRNFSKTRQIFFFITLEYKRLHVSETIYTTRKVLRRLYFNCAALLYLCCDLGVSEWGSHKEVLPANNWIPKKFLLRVVAAYLLMMLCYRVTQEIKAVLFGNNHICSFKGLVCKI